MCGLVAIFNKNSNGFTTEQVDVFKTLLLVDTLRGDDSTGAFVVHNNGDLSLAKEASTGGEFLKQKETKDLLHTAWQNGSAIIGHNRKATKGVVNDENAHPFVVDNKIVLVHNGGIWGDHKKHADVEVDSHAIAHLLAEHGDVDKALSQFHGAYALMWYDVEREEINIVRNKERPLYFVETEVSWIWASEKVMLQFAGIRNGVKFKTEPALLEEESLNTFKLVNRRWEGSHRKLKLDRLAPWNTPASSYTPPANQAPDRGSRWKEKYVFGWEGDDCDNDGAFEPLPAVIKRMSKPNRAFIESFLYTVGGNNFEKTSEFEREMIRGCNKMITAAEFNTQVSHSFLFGQKQLCQAFEYVDDGDGGYFVYASPIDDPYIVFRHHFIKESKVTEERMMSMALNEWILELSVDKKCWSPYDKDARGEYADRGYCVITSGSCKVKKGGGINELQNETENVNYAG